MNLRGPNASRIVLMGGASLTLASVLAVVAYFGKDLWETAASPPPELPPMVLIKGGKFLLGSKDGRPDERPVQEVEVKDFWMDRTEVSLAQYQACVLSGACLRPGKGDYCNSGQETAENNPKQDHPANCVQWKWAKAYCEWVGKRLPTEVEWEYAARGGAEQRRYPWGNNEPTTTSACWSTGDGTCKVGIYPDNAFGLKDMAGNVWEWVEDWYADYPALIPPGYAGPPAGVHRVARGGCWDTREAEAFRGSYRGRFLPTVRHDVIGFRCAKSI